MMAKAERDNVISVLLDFRSLRWVTASTRDRVDPPSARLRKSLVRETHVVVIGQLCKEIRNVLLG